MLKEDNYTVAVIKVGDITPTGGNLLWEADGHNDNLIFPHRLWQAGEFLNPDGFPFPSPNYGELWACRLWEIIKPGKQKYYVALPIEFLDWDYKKKIHQDYLRMQANYLKIKERMDKKEFKLEKIWSNSLEFNNEYFNILVTPYGVISGRRK